MLILSETVNFSEAVSLPNISSQLGEVIFRLFSDCYKYTMQNRRWSQSMKFKKEKTNMLASSLENPDYSKCINNYRFPTFIWHLFVLVSVILTVKEQFSVAVIIIRYSSMIMYSYTIRPCKLICNNIHIDTCYLKHFKATTAFSLQKITLNN